jgi:zinc transport system ATP-binding protein
MPQDKPPDGGALAIERGTVRFGDSRALDDVTLDVAPGTFLALLGENGSGKTTLLKALLELVPLDSGSVSILGSPLREFRQWSQIAYVPQRLLSAGAVPVSVQEAVGSSLVTPLGRGIAKRRERPERITRELEAVGLEHRRRDRLDSLSGGQQRRVLLAGALARDPDIYMLDEPTAGVDHESQERMASIFADLRRQGRTIILVTHELGSISALAERVVVLQRGRVAYDGPPPMPEQLKDSVWHHSNDINPASGPHSIVEG